MRVKDILLAVLVVVIWGVNFTFIKIGLVEIPPILFSAIRFAIVAVPMVFFIPFPKTSVWNVLGVGIFLGIIQFSLLFISMDVGLSAGLASLLLQAQVLFTIVMSYFVFKETLNKTQVMGLTMSLFGFLFFLFNTGGNVTFSGLILIILSALAWATSNLIMKRMGSINLLHFMIWVSLIPPLPLLTLSYFLESNHPLEIVISSTFPTWLAVLYVGFISTLLAYIIWGKLLKNYTAATVTPFALLIPVVGVITSNLVLGEQLNVMEVIGGILIMLGLVLCVLGKRTLIVIAGYYHKAIQRTNR